MRRYLTGAIALLLCAFALLTGGKSVAFAEAAFIDSLSGNVTLLKKDGSNYVMQVTVENDGEDFSGTVQLIFACAGYGNCAYNTEIALPAQGKKQFTVTLPERAAETVQGLCALNFLDEKERLLQSIQLKNVFGNEKSGITVGILSDNYSSLTFMDAGGMEFTIHGVSNPLELIALSPDNLRGYLDGLYFLIIDQFNVSALSAEDIQAIQDWVMKGGCLLVGTGSYAEATLSGFDKDFFEADIMDITEPGQENAVSINARHGNFYRYVDSEVDFTQMRFAEFKYDSKYGVYYESSENPAICASLGDGAMMIFAFSLGEKEFQKLKAYAIEYIYDELMSNSNSYRFYSESSDLEYVGRRALSLIDSGNTDMDFSWLELLIGIYVVLIGPILYFILRKCKKSEWYWIFVPGSALACIAGVYFFGQGMRVNDTRVYSVTVQQADGNQAETYFLAYHSGVKPWKMRLNDSYEVAGPGWSGNYYRGYQSNVNDYFYSVTNDDQGMWIGIKPDGNFENGFLYAGSRTEGKGTISGAKLKGFDAGTNVSGSITNGTGCDMAYMAVWADSYIVVFSDVKAGETLDLQQATQDGRCVYANSVPYFDNLLYNMVSYGYRTNLGYEQDDMAALLIGLGVADEARPVGEAVIVGVVGDYENAVTSKCSEISYGCLYSYAETEAGWDASN